jgi:HSP20 family protein
MNLLPLSSCVSSRSGFPERLFSEFFDVARDSNTSAKAWAPSVDVREDESSYLVTADVPGVNPSEIEVTFDKGVLSIAGERNAEEVTEEGGYRRVERQHGTFRRQLRFPDGVDADAIEARGKNGVLHIKIPKASSSQVKRIEVGH